MQKTYDPIELKQQIDPLMQKRDDSALQKIFATLNSSDIVEIFERCTKIEVAYCFNLLDNKQKSNVFSDLSFLYQNYIVRTLSTEESTAICNQMSQAELHRFLHRMPRTKAQLIAENLNDQSLKAFHDEHKYSKEQIGHWLGHEWFTVLPQMTIKEVLERFKQREIIHDNINNIFVINEEKLLLDRFSLEELVRADENKLVKDIMDFKLAKLNATDSIEYALDRFRSRDSVSLPVVDEHNKFLGVIGADDMIHLSQDFMTKKYQQMAGVTELDKPYIETTYLESFKKRGFWLLVLFVGEMLTATAMNFYEDVISQAVVLALFLPLLLSSGGNSGSQSSTLIIRALALKEFELKDWPMIFKRELIVGIMLACMLGVVAIARITIWELLGWADYSEHGLYNVWDVTIAVTIGIMAIVTWGNLVGSLLPIGLRALKLDPATISAPFLATFVDVTGLVIYFSAASAILGL